MLRLLSTLQHPLNMFLLVGLKRFWLLRRAVVESHSPPACHFSIIVGIWLQERSCPKSDEGAVEFISSSHFFDSSVWMCYNMSSPSCWTVTTQQRSYVDWMHSQLLLVAMLALFSGQSHMLLRFATLMHARRVSIALPSWNHGTTRHMVTHTSYPSQKSCPVV
jgi:hypothetical protein